jgi:hypothetical protein
MDGVGCYRLSRYGFLVGGGYCDCPDELERDWDTCAGTVEPAIPKLRSGSYFPDWLLERHRRAQQPNHRHRYPPSEPAQADKIRPQNHEVLGYPDRMATLQSLLLIEPR